MSEYPLRPGGLMRCCLASLDEAMRERAEPPQEGETMHCKYCKPDNGGMIFRDGAWEWSNPDE
jgi:hypothetical protein